MEEKIKARIMDAGKIKRSLIRMTSEILERNRNLKNLVIVGIRTRGIYLGKRISELIKELEKLDVPVGVLDITLYRDDFAELETQHMVQKTEIDFSIQKKDVLLVDDVLFTGRTIRAAISLRGHLKYENEDDPLFGHHGLEYWRPRGSRLLDLGSSQFLLL